MKHNRKLNTVVGALVSSAAIIAATAAAGETLVGSTVESRVLLGFKVADSAVQEWLPEGWIPVTLPGGPMGGANLIMALIDRHLMLDPNGAPVPEEAVPTVALLVYGKNAEVEGPRGYVTRVYEEPPVVNPYGNSVAADVNRDTRLVDQADGGRTQSENWMIGLADGGEIRVDLGMALTGYAWSEGGESRPYSSVNPEFFRIYRYDQLAGLAMNAAMGRELAGEVEISVTDPVLAKAFDGSEALVSIVTIPVYLREISLP